MLCNKCGSKMTCLFMSYVCDTCNPPANYSAPVQKSPNPCSEYFGYVVFPKITTDWDIPDSGYSKFVYETKAQAENSHSAISRYGGFFNLYKVKSKNPLTYTNPAIPAGTMHLDKCVVIYPSRLAAKNEKILTKENCAVIVPD